MEVRLIYIIVTFSSMLIYFSRIHIHIHATFDLLFELTLSYDNIVLYIFNQTSVLESQKKSKTLSLGYRFSKLDLDFNKTEVLQNLRSNIPR